MQQERITVDSLRSMALGFWPAQILFVATDLGVFTKIGDAPKTLNELVEALRIDSRGAKALLNACVALGLLEKQDDQYANSPLSTAFLIKGRPGYFGDNIRLYGRWMYTRWARLNEAVRTGKPVGRFLDRIRNDPDYAQDFTRALFNSGLESAIALAAKVDFASCKTLLDLAGGSGVYGIMIAKRYPDLKVIVFDFPIVCDVASEFIQIHQISTRVSTIGGDFFENELPGGIDVVLLSNVLHDIGLESSRLLLRKVHDALPDGGRLVIVEWLANKDESNPGFPALFELAMVLDTEEGTIYTEEEIQSLLAQTNYGEVELRELSGPFTAIVAKKIRPGKTRE